MAKNEEDNQKQRTEHEEEEPSIEPITWQPVISCDGHGIRRAE